MDRLFCLVSLGVVLCPVVEKMGRERAYNSKVGSCVVGVLAGKERPLCKVVLASATGAERARV